MTEEIKKMDFEHLVSNQLSPGQMLKQAREARNLSPIDVAKQLKLRTQWIVDIENDQYQNAASLIYVRGYLSSYARFMNLNPEEVLHVFNLMNFDEPFRARKQIVLPVEDQFETHKKTLSYSKSKLSKSFGGRIVRSISIFVFLVLTVLVVLWWKGQKINMPLAKSEAQEIVTTQTKEIVLPEVTQENPKTVALAEIVNQHAHWKRIPNKQ